MNKILLGRKDTIYNKLAGQSIERLCSLSDNIFAVGMTLLVLDLHPPVLDIIHSESDLQQALVKLLPSMVMFAMSFLTLGIFWIGQQAQLHHFSRTDRNLTWIHIAFLFTVCTVPFSTKVMDEFITYRSALIVYWANLIALGATLYASWQYARKHAIIKDNVPEHIDDAVKKRILISQGLYAFGVLLCVINTYWSVGFIVLLQLNYAIAPKFGRFLG